MTVMAQPGQAIGGRSQSSSLYDVLELILDKGLVIDAYVRVSLVGIELLTVDIRVVVASVDTYLRFAEAVNRLDLTENKNSETLPELVGDMQEQGASGKTKGALGGAMDAFSESFRRGRGNGQREDEDDDDDRRQPARRGNRSRRRDEDDG